MTAKRPIAASGLLKAKGVQARPACAHPFHADLSQGLLPILVPSATAICLGIGNPCTLPTRIHSLNSLPRERLSKPLISIKTGHEWQIAARDNNAGTFSTASR